MTPKLQDDSIVIEYASVPRDKMALFQFLCEGHDGLLVISTLNAHKPLLKLHIARDMLEDWQILRQELEEKVGLQTEPKPQ